MSTGQDFEVEQILDDKVDDGESYYLVRWKATTTKNLQKYLDMYGAEVSNTFKINDLHIIDWKDSWMPATALENCDEKLGAYLLLKLYNFNVK